MERQIRFYRTKDGKCPLEDFLDELLPKDAQKILWVLRLIERMGHVSGKYFKKLVNTDDIWECRVSSGSRTYRIFGFFLGRGMIILTHGYSKKTQKTSPREIQRAEALKKDFLDRQKGGRK